MWARRDDCDPACSLYALSCSDWFLAAFGDQDASGNLRLIRSKLLFSSPITNDVVGPDYDSGKHQYAEKAERRRHDRKIHRLILNYAAHISRANIRDSSDSKWPLRGMGFALA